MTVLFKSTFDKPDPRWQLRQIPTHIPAASDCVSVRNGHLNLDVKSQPLRSGHVWVPDFTFVYGYIEARMRFLSPHGAHAALWAQGDDYGPGQAELDVVEHFGGNPLWHNVYWREDGKSYASNEYEEFKHRTRLVDPRSWHTYGADWTPTGYEFTIDDKVVGGTSRGLSHKPKRIILSMLVNQGWEVSRFDPTARYRTQVDFVKVSRP